MKVTNIIINNVNDGLSANSLAPTGPWQENRQYKGSDGISHVVTVGLGDNPAKWDMTKAKYYYAKEDNVNKHPSQHPEVWGEVPYFEYIISASGLFGKINADQIEASAFNKKWKVLNEYYTSDDIYNLVKEGQNYYFLLPKGDIKLPILDSSSQIPIGTEVRFLLPENDNPQVRYFTGSYPLRANFEDAGIIEQDLHIGAVSVRNVCPIKSGVLHFQAVSGPYGYKWLWTNWAEFRNLDLLAKIRDVDGKVKRLLNSGSTSVDASRVSVIHCEKALSNRTTLNLFNAHYGNDVTIVIPHWAMNGGNVSINLFEGKNSTPKCKCIDISEAGVYKIYFWEWDGTGCYCIKLSDAFIDYKEVSSNNVTTLPNDNPWELPGWWDDWKVNSPKIG